MHLACLTCCPIDLNDRCENIESVISFTKNNNKTKKTPKHKPKPNNNKTKTKTTPKQTSKKSHNQNQKNKKDSFGKENEVPLQ